MLRRFLKTGYKTARQIVVGVVGTTVVLVGLVLLVLPGPAFVVIPAGLGILSLEFAFAKRWLETIKERAGSVVNGLTAAGDQASGGDPEQVEHREGRGQQQLTDDVRRREDGAEDESDKDSVGR